MHTDLQFSPGFLSLRDDRDVARLDGRLLADVGIERTADGQFEREGVVVDAPRQMPRLLEILASTLSVAAGWSFRHA